MKTQFPQVTRYLSPFCVEQVLMVWNIGIFAFTEFLQFFQESLS